MNPISKKKLFMRHTVAPLLLLVLLLCVCLCSTAFAFPTAPLPTLKTPPTAGGGAGVSSHVSHESAFAAASLASGLDNSDRLTGEEGGQSAAEALKLLQLYETEFNKLKQRVLAFIEVDSQGTPTVSTNDGARSNVPSVQDSSSSSPSSSSMQDKLAAFEKQFRFEQSEKKHQKGGQAESDGATGSTSSAQGGIQDTGLFDFPNGGEGFHYVPSQYHHPPPPPLAPPPPPPPPMYGATHLNDFGSLSNFKTATPPPSRFQEVSASTGSKDSATGKGNFADRTAAFVGGRRVDEMKGLTGDRSGLPPPVLSGGKMPSSLATMQGSVLANARKMRFQDLEDLHGSAAPQPTDASDSSAAEGHQKSDSGTSGRNPQGSLSP
eukprot:INCI7061.6.p1 GENE.INCI7061.6~~INCI7061.6.p1  ORF type:complete len:378 (+),score=66.51 INCI7061.6:398-1531(+)